MNYKIIGGIVVVVLIIGAVAFLLGKNNSTSTPIQTPSTQTTQPSTAANGQNTVVIQNFAFSPASLTVKTGDTITFTNNDSTTHTATADNNSFDTGEIAPGESKTVTLTKSGPYMYHCSIHPNMTGTIVVQ